MSEEPRVLRASEIGEFVFCHRAWWLDRIQGLKPTNSGQIALGVALHAAHGKRVERVALLRRAAQAFLAVAVLFGAALAIAALSSPR